MARSGTAAARAVQEAPVAPAAEVDELLATAQRWFLDGRRLDIEALGAEHGHSRATAYRRLGNYDSLLAEVLASLAEREFRRYEKQTPGRGRRRVLGVLERFMRAIADLEPYRALLERSPEQMLKIVTSSAADVQRRVISLIENLLRTEEQAGHLVLPVDRHTLAYAIVRVCESFLYADVISGETPDIDKAMVILGLLLPAP